MKPWTILTKLLLITLLALSASGVVSAKVASGLQNLSGAVHQGETVFNPLTHLAKIDFSYDDASESPVVTKSGKGLKPTLKQENPRNLIPTQTKSEMSGSQVKRLAKDMKQNGFDQNKPVDAWRNPKTGRLEIQDGHHRTEAAKKAGLDKIPVKIWE